MTLLSALAVAFAAFCVWLTVRIVNRDRGATDLAIVLALMFGPVVLTLAAIVTGAIFRNLVLR